MTQEPELTLNQPLPTTVPDTAAELAADKPAYVGEIYQIYKLSEAAKSLPIDQMFEAVGKALNQLPQPAAELAKIDIARRIPSVQQRLLDMSKEAK